jgi:hypothetical protein
MIGKEIRNEISFKSLFNSLIILTNKLFFYVKKQKIK